MVCAHHVARILHNSEPCNELLKTANSSILYTECTKYTRENTTKNIVGNYVINNNINWSTLRENKSKYNAVHPVSIAISVGIVPKLMPKLDL